MGNDNAPNQPNSNTNDMFGGMNMNNNKPSVPTQPPAVNNVEAPKKNTMWDDGTAGIFDISASSLKQSN